MLPHARVNPAHLDSLIRDVSSIADPKRRDMILFAVKCSREPQSLIESDYERLQQYGPKQSEIVEIISMSALAVYANIIADGTGMDPEYVCPTLAETMHPLSKAR